MPLFIRKFIVDAVETFVAAALAMELAFPGSLAEAQALGTVFAAAAFAAVVSAARRAAPAALAALREALGVGE